MSSLCRGHANLLCIVPIFADDYPKVVPIQSYNKCYIYTNKNEANFYKLCELCMNLDDKKKKKKIKFNQIVLICKNLN